jgi:hypothetical protein
MENINFSNMPKFQSPEEEIDYLKSHLAEKEEKLKNLGHFENQKDDIASSVLREYKTLPVEDILDKEHILEKKEVEQIVLKLKPEPHDIVMEELLGLLLLKGVKNALNTVESMNSPHISDDFHRLLIQYLKSGQNVDGIREGSPIDKSLNMTLFEVTLPASQDESEKNIRFKEFMGAMEQFYAGMQSISSDKTNSKENYYSLEIALDNQHDSVVVYVAVPNKHVSLFEKQVLSSYFDAKILEVTDDYNVFNEKGSSMASCATFVNRAVLPIKTYEELDHDPMNNILNVFSKLKTMGEGAAIQILVSPAGEKFTKEFHMILDDVRSGKSVKYATDNFYDLKKAFFNVSKELFLGIKKEKNKEEKYTDGGNAKNQNAVEKITTKLKSTIVKTNIRLISSAEDEDRAEMILKELESAFHQFQDPLGNAFSFERLKGSKLKDFLYKFSFRIFEEDHTLPLNLKELSSVFHFPVGISSMPQLKEAKAGIAPAPMEMGKEGILLGMNNFRGRETEIHMAKEDRVRHMYVVGQTGTGKTTILKNMIAQDIRNGEGCCFIDPHGTDIQEILSYVPKERIDDVIYFDPAYTARPMGLNMLEYDVRYPEQKTFVVNELMAIFNKLFDMKTSGGPMFEQYFKNAAFLVMDHPESGSTLLEISRVMMDKEFRDMKLSHCKNPIIKQFWIAAEQTTGDQGLANFVPYITSKFDNFISNDILRPVVLQEKSVLDFRKIMDDKKILLVNLSKGRLGDINANLIGLLIVGKIQMAALSRVDMFGQKMNDFYLYIDEFQNVTTDSIASILSEARKYRLSLNVAHQYISQLEEGIKNAVFGNVGSMAVYRVSPEDAEFLEKKFAPTFNSKDIIKLDNFNSYVSMLVNGVPAKPFSMTSHWSLLPKGNPDIVESLKELSYLKYGRDRAEVEAEILAKYEKQVQ